MRPSAFKSKERSTDVETRYGHTISPCCSKCVPWTPSISVSWKLGKMQNLELWPIGICILTSCFLFCFLWFLYTNSVINFCNHLLTGLLASTLAPPEFILLRFYGWGLSISLICIYQNNYKKDKTIFWWGQVSQTFQNPSWSRPCRIGNQRWRNFSVHAYPTKWRAT